jgi:hypothetical protein
MFAPIAASHNGCRTRSTTIRGDSARRLTTCFVLRWSAIDELPRTSAEATAVATAIGADNRLTFRTAGDRYAVVADAERNPMPSLRSADRSHSAESMVYSLASRPTSHVART